MASVQGLEQAGLNQIAQIEEGELSLLQSTRRLSFSEKGTSFDWSVTAVGIIWSALCTSIS